MLQIVIQVVVMNTWFMVQDYQAQFLQPTEALLGISVHITRHAIVSDVPNSWDISAGSHLSLCVFR